MKKFKTFIDRLRTSEQFAAKKAVDYINSTSVSDIIEEYNKKQLEVGEDANGKDLGEYGVWRTLQREEVGKQTEFIDLNFEGNFYKSIYAEGKLKGATKPSLFLDSASPEDWAAIQEDDRFTDALGLTQENADKVADMVAEHISKELNKYYSV